MNKKRCNTLLPLVQLLPAVAAAAAVLFALPRTAPVLAAVPERLAVVMEQPVEAASVEAEEEALPKLDILYMTRVQKERFFNEEDYVRLKDFYILTKAKMELAPEDMIVLHPLPRVNEISVEVDDDPRAVYFKQAQYAVYVRMALILTLLEIKVK